MNTPVLVALVALAVFLFGLLFGAGLWCGYGYWVASADRRTYAAGGESEATQEPTPAPPTHAFCRCIVTPTIDDPE